MADVQVEVCGSLTAEIKDVKSNGNSLPDTDSSASINYIPPAVNVKCISTLATLSDFSGANMSQIFFSLTIKNAEFKLVGGACHGRSEP